MKEITFTHKGKKFTLNLERGELYGDDSKLLELMHYKLKVRTQMGYVGENYEPFAMVKITDPYRDIYQFTACIAHIGYMYPIPKELKPYMPETYEEIELRELEERIKEAQKGKPESEHANIRQELEEEYRKQKEWENEINEFGLPNVVY